ncbi:hypothetical protein [Bartonella taylorii]|uniref:restriction endonuclease n=1 Tax=Bartonella taylorii TaxID=33046 RepID=UPI0030B82A85
MIFLVAKEFKIATLIGSYTPDWAVLEREGEQKLYFAHFAALEMGSSVVHSR